jgi:hypothetical protein
MRAPWAGPPAPPVGRPADFVIVDTAGSAPGPDMQAAPAFAGQTFTLGQLEGMGHLEWEGNRVARLDTTTESYRISLEPPGCQAHAME